MKQQTSQTFLQQRMDPNITAIANPFASNPMIKRSDLQKALYELFFPLKKLFSNGCARVRIGLTGAQFSQSVSELEGFARPLWGLVPLLVGGGDFADWPLYRAGFTHGSDPQHPEYWGKAEDYDQILVEMAPIGLALAMAPEFFWEPLDQSAKQNLVNWLQQINHVLVVDNNWLFFRILVNMGLENVGAEPDKKAVKKAFDRIEQFYLGDGWYSDGSKPQRDYYISFAFHYYGLIYSKLARESDPEHSQRFRERARKFSQDFIHWFAADGAALPFGRSLSYRFAQGCFWGALAFADVESLPWEVIKGLALRHIRWWAKQPIFNNDGTLSIGYAYPNLNIADQYISPASPYWALKFFLPLALSDSHPFWQAREAPLPDLPLIQAQDHPGLLLCSDKSRSHIFALSNEQYSDWLRHGEAKYAKFAYSTLFGFSVPSCSIGLIAGAYDSVLALSEDNRHFRVREGPINAYIAKGRLQSQLQIGKWQRIVLRRLHAMLSARQRPKMSSHIEEFMLYSRWQPWQDVIIDTWLIPILPWHIRLHHIISGRHLYSAEGGFAIDRSIDLSSKTHYLRYKTGLALAVYPFGLSGLRDLETPIARKGQVLFADPNTNVIRPRTAIPTLLGEHVPGEYWLICAVLGLPNTGAFEEQWENPPTVDKGSDFNHSIIIWHQDKKLVFPVTIQES
jgi:hypothetical protein